MNKFAKMERTTHSKIDLAHILNIKSFDVKRASGIDVHTGLATETTPSGHEHSTHSHGDHCDASTSTESKVAPEGHVHEESVGTVLVTCTGTLDEHKVRAACGSAAACLLFSESNRVCK